LRAGKTHCFNGLLAYVRKDKGIALAVASSGIAALLLNLGRTFHSRFKAQINPTKSYILNISAETALAKLIIRADLIVWDEAPTMHRWHLEALDRTLRDLMGNDLPMGGKVVVLGGDYRQCLPIIARAGRAEIIGACLHRSKLWAKAEVFQLTENMRIAAARDTHDQETLNAFSEYLLNVGRGTADPAPTEKKPHLMRAKPSMCIESPPREDNDTAGLDALVEHVYPGLDTNCHAAIVERRTALSTGQNAPVTEKEATRHFFAERAILCPLNATVRKLNKQLLAKCPGTKVVCLSSDVLIDEDGGPPIDVELLQTLCPTGIPEHEFEFKAQTPIMLIRNLAPRLGLCNGTRLLAIKLSSKRRTLLAQIISGSKRHIGNLVLLPRIKFKVDADETGFEWVRTQFPVRVSYLMTINKSQGQTLQSVGVSLDEDCFAHGQFYVALSRAGNPTAVRLLVPKDQDGNYCTSNVVYTEALKSFTT
jgi:ATP-dependent exoDNAse (exonuclease V) alpha subunit